jgi:hypothetical protein
MGTREEAFKKWYSLAVYNGTIALSRTHLAREAYYAAWGDGTTGKIEELSMALQMLVDEKVEYMTINHLGDPEKQHTVKAARKALAK